MEPLDKKEQDIKEEPKKETKKQEVIPESVSQTNPANPHKNNSLLVILLIVLVLAIAGIIGLFICQQLTSPSQESSQKINTNAESTISTISSKNLDNPVTTNLDSEINNLDQSMNSLNPSELSEDAITDSNLGL